MKYNRIGIFSSSFIRAFREIFVTDLASDHVALLLLMIMIAATACSGVSNMQEVQDVANCISLGTPGATFQSCLAPEPSFG